MESMNRRAFLGSAVAGSVAAPSLLQEWAVAQGPNRRLKVGLIGSGAYGGRDAEALLAAGEGEVEISAICDVDSAHLTKMADRLAEKQGSRPKTFKHYEDLLDTPGLNAVIIATPPHWHALQLIAALDRGLDIYCEKPVSYDLREGEAMLAAAAKSDRIIQVGFQRRQSKAIQEAGAFIQGGGIGDLVHVEAQIHFKTRTKDPTPIDPPASLDWNLWCGPGPKIPYSLQVGHWNWRYEKTSGNGHLVDWGIHLIDAVRGVLKDKMPTAVQATGGLYKLKNIITTPDVLTAHFDFPTCPVTWRHHLWGAQEYSPEVNNGIFFYGDKGTVFASERKWIFIPPGKDPEHQMHEVSSKSIAQDHMKDFLKAIRTRQPASCTLEDAHYSTATVNLAMIAYEVGAKIEWDAKTKRITNNKQADALLKREYRKPWQHPYRDRG